MPNQVMPAVHQLRLSARLSITMLIGAASACDTGTVSLELLSAAGAAGQAAEADDTNNSQGGQGGAGGRGSNSGSRAGGGQGPGGGSAGGPARSPYCEPNRNLEEGLLEVINDLISSGRFCPHQAPGLERPLVLDPMLQEQARRGICLNLLYGPIWNQAPRYPLWGWSLWDTRSLEDAKKALLDSDRSMLCRDAERTTYKSIGIGQAADAWSILLMGTSQESTQDGQKP